MIKPTLPMQKTPIPMQKNHQACRTNTNIEPPWCGRASSVRETTSTKLFRSLSTSTTGEIISSFVYIRTPSILVIDSRVSSIEQQTVEGRANLSKGKWRRNNFVDQVSHLATGNIAFTPNRFFILLKPCIPFDGAMLLCNCHLQSSQNWSTPVVLWKVHLHI